MKILAYKYEDEYNEMVTDKVNYVTIKDKLNEKYYEVPYAEYSLNSQIKWIEKVNYHSLFLLCTYWILFTLLFVANLEIIHLSSIIDNISPVSFLVALTIYLFVFIIVHEMGHLYMLHICGRKANKFGFKFNYIFPSFYVQINEIYMLDKVQKLYIHSAGLINSLLLNVGTFAIGRFMGNGILVAVSAYMSMTIVYNLLPFMNSDGYKILITLTNRTEKRNVKHNSKMILIIKIINIIFVIIYTIYFFVNVICSGKLY